MKRLVLALVVSLLAVILPAMPVYAFITSPTSISISDVEVFRNLAETGDVLVLFHYNMPYASDNYSTTPASESIVFQLVAENTSILQTGHPYVYPGFESNGYGQGTGGFYLEAADSFTWGSAAVINIIKQAGYFADAETISKTITLSNYVTATSQEDNRSLAEDYIYLECDRLGAAYDIELKASSDIGTVLSDYGESYFRGVVSGLQALIPGLFFIQTAIPEQMDTVSYNMTMAEQYASRLTGDDLGAGFDDVPSLFHLNKYFFWGLACFAFTIFACVFTNKRGWGTEAGITAGVVVTIGIALLIGDVIFGIVMIGSLAAAILLVWLLIFKRA